MPTSEQLKRVVKEKLGLRFAPGVQGAAYAMCDLGDHLAPDAFVRFCRDPSIDELRGMEWDARLAHTIGFSKDMAVNKNVGGTLLLVTSAPDAAAERYDQDRTFRISVTACMTQPK